ncbi:MAG TPA: ABC transporter ATP-binding protein [Acholeplasmatales bacterium]|jgi:ABC-type multidrug transport system, ATPase and permease components|nr:ABC transporter ATP-binding protein [Bacilli bacterium]MBS6562390.1 ABC transporter ATP-binding protein [Staphylococcus sp.]CDC70531.1 aBC transporter related [Staphylococcus sp. CAG:324]HAR57289.1 ABC transporter ATP-binding protein [Acholeplasmatales bacterium]
MKYGLWKTFATQVKRIKEGQISYVYVIYIINALASGVIPVIGVFFIKIIIDEITMSNSIDGFLFKMLILIVISTICLVLKSILEGILSGKFLLLRQKEFEKVIHLYHTTRYENIENSEFQDTVNSAAEALEGDGRGFEKTYSNFKIILTSLVSIILFSIILAYFNIILVIVCFLSTLLSIVINKKVADYNRKRQKDLAHASRQKNYYNNTASDFSYGKDTRIFSLKEFIMDKYNDKSLSYLKVLHDLYNKEFKYGLFGLITLLLQDGISYSIIVYSAIQGYITLSEVTLYISSIVAFTTVLRTLSDNITDLIKNLKLTMTYFEFLDSTEKEKKLNKWEFDYHEGVTIEFQNVWFKYPNTDSYIFENLNFKINKNEKIAIVGTNGAGKTTIVKLICGLFEPNKGQVLVNNVDLKTIDKEDYQKLISTVFQDYDIYALTVLENVGGINYDREKVMNCIASVGLKEVIERLPNSYDTNLLKVIDENGVDLSGGQKQKIAIARALYKEGGIVILDEPTSALDALAEASIYQQFSDLVKDKTSIYISHRLSSTKFCDRILFFNENGLQEEGTHDDLMNNKQGYYEMFMIQGKYYQEGGENND